MNSTKKIKSQSSDQCRHNCTNQQSIQMILSKPKSKFQPNQFIGNFMYEDYQGRKRKSQAILISQNVILTSAQNIFTRNNDQKTWLHRSFQFQLKGLDKINKIYEIEDYYYPSQYQTSEAGDRLNYNYAILKLKQSVKYEQFCQFQLICFHFQAHQYFNLKRNIYDLTQSNLIYKVPQAQISQVFQENIIGIRIGNYKQKIKMNFQALYYRIRTYLIDGKLMDQNSIVRICNACKYCQIKKDLKNYSENGEYSNQLNIQIQEKIQNIIQNMPNLKEAKRFKTKGSIQLEKKKYQAAQINYLKCLQIEKQIFGQYSIKLQETYFLIGVLQEDQKKYQKAAEYYRQCAIIFEINQVRDEEYCEILWLLADIYFDMGDYGTAKEWFEKTLSVAQELPDDLLIYETLRQIGNCQIRLGNFKVAKQYFLETYKIAHKLQGQEKLKSISIDIVQCLSNLADKESEQWISKYNLMVNN